MADLTCLLSTSGAGSKTVLWHNLREEPVLYINGKPYVVRESNKPFANLEYTGAQCQHCCLRTACSFWVGR